MSRARLCLCAVVLASLIARAADDTTPPPAVCRISPPARPHLIPPAIYGLAAVGAGTLTNWNVPLVRWGGNTAERYNWELGNAWNTGHDWFFENVAVEPHAANGFLSRADRAGAIAFVNVPLIGYVARNTAAAAFSVAKYGRQEHADPSHPDAGNGMRPDGQPVTGNDRFDTSVVASPEFIAAWVTQMKRDFPRLFAEHRIIVAPGNEPMLWHVTHRDVHPRRPRPRNWRTASCAWPARSKPPRPRSRSPAPSCGAGPPTSIPRWTAAGTTTRTAACAAARICCPGS